MKIRALQGTPRAAAVLIIHNGLAVHLGQAEDHDGHHHRHRIAQRRDIPADGGGDVLQEALEEPDHDDHHEQDRGDLLLHAHGLEVRAQPGGIIVAQLVQVRAVEQAVHQDQGRKDQQAGDNAESAVCHDVHGQAGLGLQQLDGDQDDGVAQGGVGGADPHRDAQAQHQHLGEAVPLLILQLLEDLLRNGQEDQQGRGLRHEGGHEHGPEEEHGHEHPGAALGQLVGKKTRWPAGG